MTSKITAISLEDMKLMDRVVVISGYMQRLVPEVGVNAIWLYTAYKQAFFMAGASGSDSAERRISADDIVRWGIFSTRTFWRMMDSIIPKMGGLLEKMDDEGIRTELYRRGERTLRRRLPFNYRLYLTPRLTRADAAFVHRALSASKTVEAGMNKLLRASRKELIEQMPELGEEAPAIEGLESMYFVEDIVRSITGEEGELPEGLKESARKLHLKIIKLWGTMHLSHIFLYKIIPNYGLTFRQAWMVAIARDKAYINSRTGEMRSEVRFERGYEEMKDLTGMSSWKGVASWTRPYKNKKGGDLSPFMREIDSPDNREFGEIGKLARRFWVQLDDEALVTGAQSSDKFGESSDKFAEESFDKFGESSDKFAEESSGKFGNSAPLKELKENTFNTLKLPPPQTPPATQKLASADTSKNPAGLSRGGGSLSKSKNESWDWNVLLKRNPGGDGSFRMSLKKSEKDPAQLVSWLLYAYSPEGEGIRSPSAFAISQLRREDFATGVYERLAKLGSEALLEKFTFYLQGEKPKRDGSGFSGFVKNLKRAKLIELAERLFEVDPEVFKTRVEYVPVENVAPKKDTQQYAVIPPRSKIRS